MHSPAMTSSVAFANVCGGLTRRSTLKDTIRKAGLPSTTFVNLMPLPQAGKMSQYYAQRPAVDRAAAPTMSPCVTASKTQTTEKQMKTAVMAWLKEGNIKRAEAGAMYMRQGNAVDASNVMTEIVMAHLHEGNRSMAEEFLLKMATMNPAATIDVKIWNKIINAYANDGEVQRVERCFLRMKASRSTPNIATFGLMCKAYAKHGRTDDVETVMGMVEQSGGKLNEYFFASLISSCGKSSPPEPIRAERAMMELVRRGLKAKSLKGTLGRVVGTDKVQHIYNTLRLDDQDQGWNVPLKHPSVQRGSASLSYQPGFR